MKPLPSLVGASEAKTKLAELLDRVRRGETITITKHEKPVARLVGCGQEIKERRENATKALKSLRKRYSLGGLDVRQLKEDGRP
jgi:prevent-host-death family protein